MVFPGGVILDLLYAMEREKNELCPHLNYNEQAAGFAAVGYAQLKEILALHMQQEVRFTNLLTAMAEAYQESIPVIFITAHSNCDYDSKLRVIADQELDTRKLAGAISKQVYMIDKVDNFYEIVVNACNEANSNRKGPVLLDIASFLWKREING